MGLQGIWFIRIFALDSIRLRVGVIPLTLSLIDLIEA